MVSQTVAIEKYRDQTQLTKEQAKEIIQTLWPKAPVTEVTKAMWLCSTYGLNPLMRHVFLIPFKNRKTGVDDWALILGIQATRMIVKRAGDYSYVDDTPRVMTNEEQTVIFGEVQGNKIWAITKLKDRHGNVAVGYGFWPRNESPYGEEKGNTTFNMAFIRSERQALDRLSAGRIPIDVKVMDESYIPVEGEEVNAVTGEIAESSSVTEAEVIPTTPPEATTAPLLPFDGKLGDCTHECWLHHGEPWIPGDYGLFHRAKVTKDCPKGFCNFSDAIKATKERLLSRVGAGPDDLKVLAKTMFEGKAWSKLNEAQQVQLLDAYWREHQEVFGLKQTEMPVVQETESEPEEASPEELPY